MVLEVEGLSVDYGTDEGFLRAVDDVGFTLEEGETLGIVGESGCGKTTVAKAIPRLLPKNGRIAAGAIRYDGTDIAELSKREVKAIRWNDIAYVVQNAMNALDPVYRVGAQFVEVIRTHEDVSKAGARERAATLLRSVGLDEARLYDYPHELSGGQRQRVVIALAIALDPPIVIADEPTTGLDVVVQDEILELLTELQAERGSAMLFITHDISAVAEVADRVVVMYGGRVAEVGDVSDVFKRSAHPYTMGLRNAFPSLEESADDLVSIPGSPPDLTDPPPGCRFADRCPFATEECVAEAPALAPVSDDHRAKCHFIDRAEAFRAESRDPATWQGRQP